MKRWAFRVGGTLIVIALLFGTFLVVGSERVWTLFGPADLGPISFETLVRRTSPNDALACPADICKAKSDVAPPEFAMNAHDLRLAFGKAIGSEPRLLEVAPDDATLTDRYVQRSRLMHFPDTVVVRFCDRPGGRSTVALYSRSQLGKGDMGVNLARVERWLAELEAVARPVN